MVVPLPIGALTFAAATDLLGLATRDPFWARASRLLLTTGVATAAVAGPIGAVDLLTTGARHHRIGWLHGGGNVLASGLTLASLALRRDASRVPKLGAALSLLNLGILGVTGWLGGELSYRHRVGVIPAAGQSDDAMSHDGERAMVVPVEGGQGGDPSESSDLGSAGTASGAMPDRDRAEGDPGTAIDDVSWQSTSPQPALEPVEAEAIARDLARTEEPSEGRPADS
jgi:uncharacterized membrane protein